MKPPDIRRDPGYMAAARQELLAGRVPARVLSQLDVHDGDDATESARPCLYSAENAAFNDLAEFRLALTLAATTEDSP